MPITCVNGRPLLDWEGEDSRLEIEDVYRDTPTGSPLHEPCIGDARSHVEKDLVHSRFRACFFVHHSTPVMKLAR